MNDLRTNALATLALAALLSVCAWMLGLDPLRPAVVIGCTCFAFSAGGMAQPDSGDRALSTAGLAAIVVFVLTGACAIEGAL